MLADPVDAFWVSTAAGFDGKPFKSISQGDADIKAIPLVEGQTPPAEATAESRDADRLYQTDAWRARSPMRAPPPV